MDLIYKDRGEFLRGFLILVKKDNKICESEKNMTKVFGKHFGFAEKFGEESINTLLENDIISEEPPIFSNMSIAEFFVKESYNIFSQISNIDKRERTWLIATANANKLNADTVFL